MKPNAINFASIRINLEIRFYQSFYLRLSAVSNCLIAHCGHSLFRRIG